MTQEELRNKLATTISSGLSAVSISRATNISRIDLSRFKNGQIYLTMENAEKLKRFLEQIKIPTSV